MPSARKLRPLERPDRACTIGMAGVVLLCFAAPPAIVWSCAAFCGLPA